MGFHDLFIDFILDLLFLDNNDYYILCSPTCLIQKKKHDNLVLVFLTFRYGLSRGNCANVNGIKIFILSGLLLAEISVEQIVRVRV